MSKEDQKKRGIVAHAWNCGANDAQIQRIIREYGYPMMTIPQIAAVRGDIGLPAWTQINNGPHGSPTDEMIALARAAAQVLTPQQRTAIARSRAQMGRNK